MGTAIGLAGVLLAALPNVGTLDAGGAVSDVQVQDGGVRAWECDIPATLSSECVVSATGGLASDWVSIPLTGNAGNQAVQPPLSALRIGAVEWAAFGLKSPAGAVPTVLVMNGSNGQVF